MLRTLSNIDIRHEIVFKSAIDMSICTVSMDAADRFKVVNRWALGGSQPENCEIHKSGKKTDCSRV
jgi:hypothetical protein